MGCVASISAPPPRVVVGTSASGQYHQRLDKLPDGSEAVVDEEHGSQLDSTVGLARRLSGKYTPRGGDKSGSITQDTLLSMAMEADVKHITNEVALGRSRALPLASIHDEHHEEMNKMPDLVYSIRQSAGGPHGSDTTAPPDGVSTQSGLSKNVITNRPTVRNLQPGSLNAEFSDQHGGHVFVPLQPFNAGGPRGMPFVPMQQAHGTVLLGPPVHPMPVVHGHPRGVFHLAPLDPNSHVSGLGYDAASGFPLRPLGGSPANVMVGRGHGLQTLVVGPAPTIGPWGFRGPARGLALPGGVPMDVGLGRGQPLQVVIPGSQNSQCEDSTRHQQPVTASKRTGHEAAAVSDDDDDDNDDLEEDDEEVEDWGLDAVAAGGATDKPTFTSTTKEQNVPQTFGPTKVPPPLSPSMKPHTINAAVSVVHKPKFRPAFEIAGDGIETIDSGSDGDVDSDDDDDDNKAGEADDELHDWLDTTRDTGRLMAKSSHNALSQSKLTHRHPETQTGTVSRSTTPQSSPTRSSHAMPSAPPTSRQGIQMPTGSPHPPLPSQRTSLRQLHGPVATGQTSPTRPAGPPPVAGSTIKSPSYRSNIVTNAVPLMVPHLSAVSSPMAGAAEQTAASAIIRDTKVVKKKRAELPQTNLPHPAPKFGDWLNSRTMINNYIILEPLGAGSYAEVKLCKEKVTGKLFAMKFINRDIMKKDKLGKQSKLDDIKREIAIMKKLSHPNVLRLYEVMDDPTMNKLFLVLEYMKHGDLLSHQKKKNPNGENLHDRDLHCVTLQVILGLAYLHEQKIVHGDIKPQNLLVGDKDVVKIADFGISQSLYGSKQKLSDTAGTPAFMSPEMCSGEEYSGQLADIWAVGATIFMLKYGQPPFVAKSAMQMFERIQNDPLVFPGPIDPLLEDLLRGMLTKNPLKRTTLLQVMTHPWVTKEEHPSHFMLKEKSPQITVTNDEVDNAIDAGDKFAIMVNIRVQMMKRLQIARNAILIRSQLTAMGGHNMATHQMFAAGLAAHTNDSTHATPTKVSSEQADKSLPNTSTKSKTKSQRVFVDAGGVAPKPPANREGVQQKILSNEEIHYRSQLFTRKKASGVAGSNAASNSAFPNVTDHDDLQVAELADVGGGLGGVDDDECEDVLSDDEDDDDDEHAVSQSPQLLDELLLTTLSMPPLTKSTPASAALHTKPPTATVLPASIATTTAPNHTLHIAPDMQSFYGQNHALNVSIAVASLQGRRNTQEDRWTVVTDIDHGTNPRWAQSLFAGLYDGHGGEECANILQEQLHTWLLRAPDEYFESPDKLESCFLEFDSFLCDFLLHKSDLSGSTATCLFVDRASSQPARGVWNLLVSHVGDCRLVVTSRHGGGSTVRELTQDHRLTLAAERDRVVQLGGRVVNNRVNGVMAITRAFGDLEFKGRLRSGDASSSSAAMLLSETAHQNPFQRDDETMPALLTARPDVHWCRVDARDAEFLLLACDGLWDVMTSDEAAEILRDRVHFHGDLSLAAKELAQEGIRRFSNDNISVIVVQFPLVVE